MSTVDQPSGTTGSRIPSGAAGGWKTPAVVVASVFVVSVCITWVFFVMRSVMGVGGSCADGGPYVSAQPCPDGTWLIAVAIPLMIITSMIGSAAAISVLAPNLLIPMWGLLFGSLGWNFIEFTFKGTGIEWGWLVCGLVFWLMALPAVVGILASLKSAVLPPRTPPPGGGSRWWAPAYTTLAALGFTFGWWSFGAIGS